VQVNWKNGAIPTKVRSAIQALTYGADATIVLNWDGSGVAPQQMIQNGWIAKGNW